MRKILTIPVSVQERKPATLFKVFGMDKVTPHGLVVTPLILIWK